MPAMAREPSGTRVLVLCGQPEQNQGWRSAPLPSVLSTCSVCCAPSRMASWRSMRAVMSASSPAFQPLGDGARDQRRRQVGRGAQQQLAVGLGATIRRRPCRPRRRCELAHHIGAHVGAPVVQLFLELVFDHLALFLDHQDFLQPGGELARGLRLQRPHHAHLVQADAQLAAGGVVQPQVQQRLARVVVGLAAGDDAEAVLGPRSRCGSAGWRGCRPARHTTCS
jgi:hypothetical protein